MSDHHEHVHSEDCLRAVSIEPLLLVVVMPPSLLGGPPQTLVRGTAPQGDAPGILRRLADDLERRYRASMS